MGKRRSGGRKNFLRKINAEYQGYSRGSKHGYYTEDFLKTIGQDYIESKPQIQYILKPIDYVERIVYFKDIPKKDPRYKLYKAKPKLNKLF